MFEAAPTPAVAGPSPIGRAPGTVGGGRRRKRAAAPIYLLDVTAAPGRRTRADGVLWSGVLNATPDDDTDGPSPIESLLAALAGCLTRNLRATADSAHITLAGIAVRIAATRSDDPPAVTSLVIDADITSGAPVDRVRRVVELALRYGTITRTLARACPLELHLSINHAPVDFDIGTLLAPPAQERSG